MPHTLILRLWPLVIATLLPLITACIPGAHSTIKIALVAPFTGRHREIGYQAIHGARLALSEYTAALGVQGHPVELLPLDDTGDPQAAIEQANKLLADPDVVAVIGHWLDNTTIAATPIYFQAGLPILATTAAPVRPLEGGRLFFRLYPTTDILSEAMKTIARDYGIESTCQCDVTDGVASLAHTHNNTPVLPSVGGPLWSLQEFIHIAGPKAEGIYFITPAPHPLVSPAASPFLARHRRSFPNEPVGWVSVHAYEATRILLVALSQTPQPTATNVAAAIAATNYSSDMLGEVQFTEEGEWQTPNYNVYKWTGGHRALPQQP